jgi:hypothetical protein
MATNTDKPSAAAFGDDPAETGNPYRNPNFSQLPNGGKGNSASPKVFEKSEHRRTRTTRSKNVTGPVETDIEKVGAYGD